MALKIVAAFLPPAEDLPFGLTDDRPLADQAMAAIEGGEATLAAERISGIGDRGLEADATTRIAAAMADRRIGLRSLEVPTI
jgi:hypothetical protein